jgi:RNA polymerase sigma-70 factor (ECF subfamily)
MDWEGPPDDSAIRQAWEAGDVDRGSAAIIERLGPEVLQYLSGILVDPDDAHDAFSLFCERVWLSFPRLEWRCSVRTWAYVIARRASVDVVRDKHRHERRLATSSDSTLQAVPDQVHTTTPPVLRTEGHSASALLCDELSPDDRALLVLRVDRGMPWQELAHVFLDKESVGEDELRREALPLRERFQLVRKRLREVGIQVTIDASGGNLATRDGILVVRVPPNAVAISTVFSAQRAEAPARGLVGPAYNLGPSGTAFSLPVMLSFHYAAISPLRVNPQALRIVTFVAGAWQPVASFVDATAQTVVASVAHFSIWGLSTIGPEAGASDGGDLRWAGYA